MVSIFYQAERRNPLNSIIQLFTQSEKSTFSISFNVVRDNSQDASDNPAVKWANLEMPKVARNSGIYPFGSSRLGGFYAFDTHSPCR